MTDILGKICKSLNAEEELNGLSGVFTHVAPETLYPYITLEKTKTDEGCEAVRAVVIVKVWSRYAGDAEVSDYERKLKNIVERPQWISGMCLKLTGSKVKILNDGLTRILEMTLDILVRGE